jgi:hypothetical protein
MAVFAMTASVAALATVLVMTALVRHLPVTTTPVRGDESPTTASVMREDSTPDTSKLRTKTATVSPLVGTAR